ncbi:hypothetical protein [Actinomadura alba]|uniref:DUF2812 domain-containing protein n=1 Tax=Actinomadura alba TaxID=406431 RepID=A0ABR7LVI6_9ACTN|nr:hypothetical protein [Actinomadura alba]MBC6468862.1 hypothetical protein [Actinomadura alba]
MTSYFDTLAERLRESGLSDEQIASTIDDLATYVTESGAAPEEEFGPAADFAEQLTAGHAQGADSAPSPEIDPAPETWRWTADAFHERKRLNEFGDQGWEVERVDALGHFVSHRDPARPQRWEYRRETVVVGGRAKTADRLAPDGWEPCGTWVVFEYFKRPKSASLGPAGELDEAPDGPGRRIFWSKRFYVFFAGYAAFLGAIALGRLALGGDALKNWFLIGLLAGGVMAAAWVVIGQRRARRREL